MNDVLADTQAIIWYLLDPPRLSPAAKVALLTAELSGRIYVSTITLMEVNYLQTKASFQYPSVLPILLSDIANPAEPIEALPVTVEVARALDQVPRIEVPDMPDRIIAATAVAHKLP